jgi:hypothetical protein
MGSYGSSIPGVLKCLAQLKSGLADSTGTWEAYLVAGGGLQGSFVIIYGSDQVTTVGNVLSEYDPEPGTLSRPCVYW